VKPASTRRWAALLVAAFALLALIALAVAMNTQQRLRSLERELVRRQQDTQGQSGEARLLARQAQDAARDAVAKVALLEARLGETSWQRDQLDELVRSVGRARDENVLADVESAVRLAQQQSAITGSSEPLLTALKQADDRLARVNQPRLERVRRAIARDIDRVKAAGTVDLSTLTIRLDEAARMIDELPLLALSDARRPLPARELRDMREPHALQRAASSPAAGTPRPQAPAQAAWAARLDALWQGFTGRVADEARTLVRVTRVDAPDAALLAPEQAWFLRENVKLRLLNARLGLLSRQFDTAQMDLAETLRLIERYFDPASRRTAAARDLIRQVAGQARQVQLPRPDDTLTALAAAVAVR
jgi:uroporphyrin-3 C-methyltransferase